MLDALTIVEHAADEGEQISGFEGLGDVGIGTDVETFDTFVERGLGGEQDDGDVAVGDIFLEKLAELQTIHAQHHHVADDEVGLELRHGGECFGGTALCEHIVVAAEDETQEIEDFGFVVDNEHGGQ